MASPKLAYLALALVLSPALPLSAQSRSDIEWRAYGNDAGGSHYSEAADIDRGNVAKLRVAWTFRTHALEPPTDLNKKAAFEATALMVGGALYLSTPFDRVIALDPATGRERWSYDPQIDRSIEYSEVTSRGVAVWRGAKQSRVFIGTLHGRLIALDAKTGKLCRDFGNDGHIDLHGDADAWWAPDYQVTSPPAIIGDLVVVGSSISDNGSTRMARGIVRAYDVRTGRLRWTFDPLPDAINTSAANVWGLISVDPKLGLVFLPTSSPSPDYFGGLRPGDNRYANSVVAVDAKDGKVAWHFQVVHHDLWDYDVASQPMLVKAKGVEAVAVTTKIGHLFLLDRRSGKPLFPVEERPVPRSDVAEETASPTQPFPANPPLVPMSISESDIWGATPEDRARCLETWRAVRYEGVFTPPSTRGVLVYPSNIGGVNWGGAAHDPRRGLLIAPVNRLPVYVRLIPRDAYDKQRAAGGDRLSGEFSAQRKTPYGMFRGAFLAPSGLPCIAPPWGMLVAIDLRDGTKKWDVPLGTWKLPNGQTANGIVSFGGPLVTAGGLVFMAGTIRGDALRAFDVDDGKLLWESPLPASAQASPMTFRYRGRQYLVIAAGGHGKNKSTMGDMVVAYALP